MSNKGFLMKRDEYLAHRHVRGFTEWAAQLVTGELSLTHRWKNRRTDFACTSLYDALEQYRWPDNANGLDYRVTERRLREFRLNFEDMGAIDSRAKQAKFVNDAEAIMRWGGIRHCRKLNDWRSMSPERLQALVEDVRTRLNPRTVDTDDLGGLRYMGPGFSKVYSAMIDGFPMYDSRVACALNCLVGIYCRREKVGQKPDSLKLRMPPRQEPKHARYHCCDRPRMNNDSGAYALDNLKAAWLLGEMVREPGEFEQVGFKPVDGLQHALFMVGYASLPDSAIPAA